MCPERRMRICDSQHCSHSGLAAAYNRQGLDLSTAYMQTTDCTLTGSEDYVQDVRQISDH